WRTGLFFPFEQDRHAARKDTMHVLPVTAGLDEEHELALVIRGSPGTDDLAPIRQGLAPGLEWIAVREFERIDGLHVVMSVKKNVRRIRRGTRMMRHHHRMACRIANFGGESDLAELPGKPLCRTPAICGKGGVGGDRRK